MNFYKPVPSEPTPDNLKPLLGRLEAGLKTRLLLFIAPMSPEKNQQLQHLANKLASKKGAAVVWMEIDDQDNDPVHFIQHLASALSAAFPDLNLAIFPAAVILDSVDDLLNFMSDRLENIFILMNDYDKVVKSAVHALTTHLIEYLPPQAHILIAVTKPPQQLALAHLRVRRQLMEVWAGDNEDE
jgi:LuxR family transcriptional regulator, maltose regulon positive regulatory protein